MAVEDNDKVLGELRLINGRLAKIEAFLWPPIDPPDRPKGPTDDPPILGPSDIGKLLQNLSEKFDELDRRAASKKELEDLREQLAFLSIEITGLKESYELLARYMRVPG